MSPHPYSNNTNPGSTLGPECILTITWNGQSEACDAVIDSGCSWTSIPLHIIQRLSLRKLGAKNARGATSNRLVVVNRYVADLSFLGFNFPAHPFYDNKIDVALIGREILNQYVTTLDGPNLNFTIQ